MHNVPIKVTETANRCSSREVRYRYACGNIDSRTESNYNEIAALIKFIEYKRLLILFFFCRVVCFNMLRLLPIVAPIQTCSLE